MSSDQEVLRRILAQPEHPEVRLLDGSYRKVSAEQARLMASRSDYEWTGTTRRVRKMRPLKPRLPWIACYRTTESATLPPSIKWCRSLVSVS